MQPFHSVWGIDDHYWDLHCRYVTFYSEREGPTERLVIALMMFLRIKALYNRQYIVLGIVAFMGIFSFAMNAALMTRGVAVVHNPLSGVRGMYVLRALSQRVPEKFSKACTMIFEPEMCVLIILPTQLCSGSDRPLLRIEAHLHHRRHGCPFSTIHWS